MKKLILLGLFFVLVLSGCNAQQKEVVKELTVEEAKAKSVKFINENLMRPGTTVEIGEVVTDEDTNMYKMKVDIGDGQEIESFITKDGKKFFPQMLDIAEVEAENEELANKNVASNNTPTQVKADYSGEELEKIKEFVSCLATKDFKIYGANWCGWTKKLVVDTFGGFDIVEPIYIECTEKKDVCASEGVEGYPTIKVNGETYEGGRDFKSFEAFTGCAVPEVVVPDSAGGAASCGS